jgi:tRNA 2-selenouridine synthase
MKHTRPTVADLAAYDTIIDVRSPAEFAEDHIPGAINCPVLDNEQRIRGRHPLQAGLAVRGQEDRRRAGFREHRQTPESQLSRPPEKLEAADLLLARRRPQRLDDHRLQAPSAGMPGNSTAATRPGAAMSSARLETNCPAQFRFTVLCGATGSAKTRILQAIGTVGEQVLDLETLASHKGSVLGVLPGQPQPTQKGFRDRPAG